MREILTDATGTWVGWRAMPASQKEQTHKP